MEPSARRRVLSSIGPTVKSSLEPDQRGRRNRSASLSCCYESLLTSCVQTLRGSLQRYKVRRNLWCSIREFLAGIHIRCSSFGDHRSTPFEAPLGPPHPGRFIVPPTLDNLTPGYPAGTGRDAVGLRCTPGGPPLGRGRLTSVYFLFSVCFL